MFFYNAKIFSIKFDRVKVHHRYAERNKWVNSQHWRVVSYFFTPRKARRLDDQLIMEETVF